MKKLFALIIFVACAFSGFCAGDGFTITGKIESVKSAHAYLIVMNAGQRDTIATAPVEEGAFTLQGSVESLQVASLVFEGMNGQIQIYLENATYTIALDNGIVITGGGETQAIATLFNEIQRGLNVKGRELNQAFTTARGDNDTTRMAEIMAEYQALTEQARAEERQLIVANPNSLVSLNSVVASANTADYETLSGLFALLSDEMKNTTSGKNLADRLVKMEAVSVGHVAPDFELDTPDGGKITLHGVKAKIKLIDFWASWCGPCRGENPNVVAMYNEYHPKGLEIVGVSLDRDKEAWIKAIADDGLTWVHGSDLQFWQAAPAKLYMVNSIPHTVLLDENNLIIAKNLRGAALKAKIAELLDLPNIKAELPKD
jgi:thiol-disulfide isomerase/thioredoxin